MLIIAELKKAPNRFLIGAVSARRQFDFAGSHVNVLFLSVSKGKPHRPLTRFRSALLFTILLFCSSGWILAQAVPLSLEDYFRQAKELEKREDYVGAEKIYQEAAANFPQQPEVLKRLDKLRQTYPSTTLSRVDCHL